MTLTAPYEDGGTQIMEHLWTLCRERMWREACRILRDPHEAEDAVMDAIERMTRHQKKLAACDDGELIALSVIYTRHTAIDIYNRRKKAPVPMEELTLTEVEPDPAEATTAGDLEDRIYRLLNEMPTAMRDVLNLHVHYSYSIGEIADALHITGGTVRTRLSRGRKWLKERLAEEGVEIYG